MKAGGAAARRLPEQGVRMRVFVSGASGFVGRHLVHHLLEASPDVEVVGTTHRQPVTGGEPRLRLVACDLNRGGGEDLRRLIAGAAPDHVYHLAALSSGAASDRDAVFGVNVQGTRRLMAAVAQEAPLARCLFASSGYVYGPCDGRQPAREGDALRPIGVYAESKREAEEYAREAGALVARAFNHAGPGQSDAFVVSAFARQIARIERATQGPQIEVGNLDARRDFLDVRDVVRAYHAVLSMGERAETYNVCKGEAHPLQAILSALMALSSSPIAVSRDSKRMRPDDVAVSVGDPAKLVACTGWAPRIALPQTLRETLDWWRTRS